MILPPIGRRRRRRRQRRRRELQKTLIRRCIAWLSTEEHTECAGLGGMAGSKNRTGVDGARKSVFKHPPTWLYQPNANGNDMIAAHKLRTQYAKRRLRKNSMDKYKSDLYDPEDRLHGHDGLSSGDDEAESLSNQNYTTDLFSGLQVDSADDFFYARMVTGQPHTPAASLVHLVDANEDTYKCGVNANTNINVHVHVRGDENVNGNGNGNGNGEILGPSKTGVDSDADIDSVMLHLQSLVQGLSA
ncbi:hypothetical protein SARC_14995 [Sphaeroforma arctica JP610]|uniref:Uncharacterized protein n=1 Tax=Sphaeroforma arctica JP610 TaxID=667725 RepID=A0A0L0F6V0_9EUKA|nr:hypothetical protein SARC_14995 [Sphaeroforma arctica JP610]KNC72445.1 hypothetical protein SARC_14995 [Sphaeroforma arctica JP610]|eukprot:XP_014146347.1 hypothetical protein SARC_14995 [Sphaeroforma arctica JP610]